MVGWGHNTIGFANLAEQNKQKKIANQKKSQKRIYMLLYRASKKRSFVFFADLPPPPPLFSGPLGSVSFNGHNK